MFASTRYYCIRIVIYNQYFHLHNTVVDCDVLDTIENGYIEYSDGTVYQSVATYNCHNGHNLAMSGDEMRTCGSDGNWNGTAPTCNSESKLDNIGMSLFATIYVHL